MGGSYIHYTYMSTMGSVKLRTNNHCGYWHYISATQAQNPPPNTPQTTETPPTKKQL